MIIAQVCLRLATIKGMSTAGMSSSAVARELNVHFHTMSRLQRHFREFGSTSNRPHNHRPRVTTPAQDLRSSPPRSSETSHPDSCCCQKPSQGSSSACSSSDDLTAPQFVVVTDLSGQMLTFDGVWHFGEVFSS